MRWASSRGVASPGALPVLSLMRLCVLRIIQCETAATSTGTGTSWKFAPHPWLKPEQGKGRPLLRVGTVAFKASDGPKSSTQAVLSLLLSAMANSLSPQQLAPKGSAFFSACTAESKVSDRALLLTVIYTHCPWYHEKSLWKYLIGNE